MPTAHHQGRNIYYESRGSGPAVVLLHSFLCDGEMCSHQVAQLAAVTDAMLAFLVAHPVHEPPVPA
ncbi:hypothetical protein [uncultured Microbulbifer sp.]|uniref:alpha/beta fold hydrolase n=1 Tax=uncultured Microbulbifer sp. TaxID=348147 RepID=UPI0025CF899E|nr:hypothetical protein [uncultured Microbulbifer sp.]